MANSLFPAYVHLNWHSVYAPHVMLLPTREYNALPSPAFPGSFEAWDTSIIAADDMVEAFTTLLKACIPTDGGIDSYIIYTLATPDAEPVIGFVKNLPLAGTDADAFSTVAAVQITLSYIDTEGERGKITLLDKPNELWTRVTNAGDVPTEEAALFTEFSADTNAWQSRNGAQPILFRSRTATLNEKLRRSYRLS
jgi:hypothetical protein